MQKCFFSRMSEANCSAICHAEDHLAVGYSERGGRAAHSVKGYFTVSARIKVGDWSSPVRWSSGLTDAPHRHSDTRLRDASCGARGAHPAATQSTGQQRLDSALVLFPSCPLSPLSVRMSWQITVQQRAPQPQVPDQQASDAMLKWI